MGANWANACKQTNKQTKKRWIKQWLLQKCSKPSGALLAEQLNGETHRQNMDGWLTVFQIGKYLTIFYASLYQKLHSQIVLGLCVSVTQRAPPVGSVGIGCLCIVFSVWCASEDKVYVVDVFFMYFFQLSCSPLLVPGLYLVKTCVCEVALFPYLQLLKQLYCAWVLSATIALCVSDSAVWVRIIQKKTK